MGLGMRNKRAGRDKFRRLTARLLGVAVATAASVLITGCASGPRILPALLQPAMDELTHALGIAGLARHPRSYVPEPGQRAEEL